MATLFCGLMLALLLGFGKRAGQPTNLFLSSALVVIVLKTGGLTPLLLPSLGQLLYFYVRQLTCPDQKFRRKDMLHFSLLLTGYWMPTWLILVSVIIYLYLAHRLVEDFYHRLKPVLMDKPRFAFRRLDRALFLLGLFCALSLFNDIFFFGIALALIAMVVEAILKPSSDIQLTTPVTDRSDAREKGRRLREAVAANRLYEDAELTLATLAIKLAIHPHDLSRIINVGLDKNFSDFINEFRVREVARKIQDPAYDHLTFLGIAYEAGFNSKTTFNRVFREVTGKTPLEYKNSMEKGVPIDKLAPLPRIRPVILRSESPPIWAHGKLKRNIMIRNYLKIAWRNLVRDRRFTLLNLIGLSTGLACTFLIVLWINREVDIDSVQDKGLYEVMQNVPLGDKSLMTITSTPAILANALKEEVPGIADAAAVKTPDSDDESSIISYGGSKAFEASEVFATTNFFRLFNYKLLKGDPAKVLANDGGILLSDRLAEKLFHSTDNAVGKTITWYKGLHKKINGTYIVSGIFAAPGPMSSLQFDVIFPQQRYLKTTTQDVNWNSSAPGTYITLKPGVDPKLISKQIKYFIRKKTGDTVWSGTLFLQRFKDTYLHNHYENGKISGGRVEYIKLFSILAVFLLVIACINFMNLSTAKATARLKEVGIKKVIGASRGVLVWQYLGESVLMACAAMIIGVGIVVLLLPYFERLIGADLQGAFRPDIFLKIVVITLITGLLAGSYPALYLSRFKPSLILKGPLNFRMGGAGIRKALVVFQFCISAVLIISVVVIYRQMQFIQTRNLGYDKNDVISFKNEGNIQKNLGAFLTDVRSIAGVANVSDMAGDLFGNHSGGSGIDWPGKATNIEFSGFYVDYNLLETLGLQMKEGRTFSASNPADSTAIIFNETAIREMGLKDPLGKTVKFWGLKTTIIGVVKDFHYESLYKMTGPLFIGFRKNNQNILLKMSPGTENETIAKIGSLYRSYNHGLPFEYKFLNEDFHNLYAAEERVSALSKWTAGIAILISCLGLFGVAAFMVQRRQKEIGVRKAIGASVTQLTTLLSSDFIKLVLIAFVMAVPLSWWALSKWLQNFAYHIPIRYEMFLIPGAALLLIALTTVSAQTIKGALANPVKSLRSE